MTKISVILACYNGDPWIGEAIESILTQKYNDLELIIVDDGSTDNSKNVITPYLSDTRVHYIFQENRGFSSANNRGLEESDGDLIGFIGQDDIWMPNKLKEQVEYFKKRQTIDLVHSNLYHIDSEGTIFKRRDLKVPHTDSTQETVKELFLRNFICFQTALVKKRCFDETGLFDERMIAFSDHDMWLRMAGKFNFAYLTEPLVKKRYHKKQLTVVRREATIKDEFLLLEKAQKQYPFLKKYAPKALARQYYIWGLTLLEKGYREDAKQKFLLSIQHDPYNIKVLLAYGAPSLYKFFKND